MVKLVIPDQVSSIAFGINKYGEVVGTYNGVSPNGFFWTQGQGMRDLATLGCVGCSPNAINDRHQVVGSVSRPDGTSHAFIWTKAGGMKDLGTLGGPNSSARAINTTGQVVGMSDVAGGVQHGFLWTKTLGMQDLGTLPAATPMRQPSTRLTSRRISGIWAKQWSSV
jgi:probable HAF family extracellular repeat protein